MMGPSDLATTHSHLSVEDLSDDRTFLDFQFWPHGPPWHIGLLKHLAGPIVQDCFHHHSLHEDLVHTCHVVLIVQNWRWRSPQGNRTRVTRALECNWYALLQRGQVRKIIFWVLSLRQSHCFHGWFHLSSSSDVLKKVLDHGTWSLDFGLCNRVNGQYPSKTSKSLLGPHRCEKNNESWDLFYPLVMTNIAVGNHHYLIGKSTINGHVQ